MWSSWSPPGGGGWVEPGNGTPGLVTPAVSNRVCVTRLLDTGSFFIVMFWLISQPARPSPAPPRAMEFLEFGYWGIVNGKEGLHQFLLHGGGGGQGWGGGYSLLQAKEVPLLRQKS